MSPSVPGSWRRSQVLRTCSGMIAILVGVVGCAARADAQSADSVRAALRLPVPAAEPAAAVGMIASAISPSAFGASWGDVFIGAGYQARARYVKAYDGAVAGGIGLGNPVRFIGIEVGAVSFSTFRSGWGKRAAVDLKLHRMLTANTAVAVGHESVLLRGKTDGLASRYAVISHTRDLRAVSAPWIRTVSGNLGIGDGRFRSETAWKRGDGSANVFASTSVQVAEQVAVVVDWTGQDLVLAASIVPFRRLPLVLTPGMMDVTGRAGDGIRLGLAGSLGFRFTD
jgi:hypothetical protein